LLSFLLCTRKMLKFEKNLLFCLLYCVLRRKTKPKLSNINQAKHNISLRASMQSLDKWKNKLIMPRSLLNGHCYHSFFSCSLFKWFYLKSWTKGTIVRKQTTNSAVLGKPGRFPLSIIGIERSLKCCILLYPEKVNLKILSNNLVRIKCGIYFYSGFCSLRC
jgi:hypothetical protein